MKIKTTYLALAVVIAAALGMIIPIKTYIPPCSEISSPERMRVLLGETKIFDAVVKEGDSMAPGPTMGVCKTSTQRLKLYVL